MINKPFVAGKRVFVAKPSAGDRLYLVCVHGMKSSALDSFVYDEYELVATRLTVTGALDVARRLGSRRPAVI